MKLRIFLFAIPLFGLNSCFIAEDFLLPDPEPEEVPLQQKAEEVIVQYIQAGAPGNTYKSYWFTPVRVIETPESIRIREIDTKLDQRTADSTRLRFERDSLASRIARYKLNTRLKTMHLFTLTDDKGQIHICRINFSVDDTLQVVETDPEILLSISDSYAQIYDYFETEATLLYAETYGQSQQLSHEFYAFFKQHLEQLTTCNERSEFLGHALKLCRMAKVQNQFDQQKFLEYLVADYILEKRQDIENYIGMNFTKLYEEEDTENSVGDGYYFFHKFSGSFQGISDTHAVMIQFSPWYEIDGIYQLEPPYDNYFN